MSSRLIRAETVPEQGSDSNDIGARPRSRAATVKNEEIETVEETSEPSSATPQKTPSVKSARRRVLNISEASVPPPQSSEIFAQGEVFVPDHTRESNHAECSNWTLPDESADDHPELDNSNPQHKNSAQNPPDTGDEAERSGTASTTDFERLSPLPPHEVPEIWIHRPSDTDSNMAALGTGVISNAATARASPTTAVTAPTEAAATLPAQVPGAETLPLAAPVNIPNPGLPAVDVARVGVPPVNAAVPAGNLPVGGKVGKRKHVIGKARKVLLRRRLLSMLLGRELAGTVHSLLNSAGGAAGPVDVPVDLPVPASGVPL
jgi:hypothetical protein